MEFGIMCVISQHSAHVCGDFVFCLMQYEPNDMLTVDREYVRQERVILHICSQMVIRVHYYYYLYSFHSLMPVMLSQAPENNNIDDPPRRLPLKIYQASWVEALKPTLDLQEGLCPSWSWKGTGYPRKSWTVTPGLLLGVSAPHADFVIVSLVAANASVSVGADFKPSYKGNGAKVCIFSCVHLATTLVSIDICVEIFNSRDKQPGTENGDDDVWRQRTEGLS